MSDLQVKVNEFLSQRRVAVAGVSRGENGAGAGNLIYRKFRDSGYETFAINPRADEVEGVPCYHTLKEIPGGVDAVVVAAPPKAAEELVRECDELGIQFVWMHRGMGPGSVSSTAADYCEAHGINVIAGACPLMYLHPDLGHKCIRWVHGVLGKLPD